MLREKKRRRLRWLCVNTNPNSQTENGKRYEELEDLDNELRGLVLIVVRLFWRCVFGFLWYCRWINLSNVVLFHHLSGALAVSHILKIIRCILPFKSRRINININMDGSTLRIKAESLDIVVVYIRTCWRQENFIPTRMVFKELGHIIHLRFYKCFELGYVKKWSEANQNPVIKLLNFSFNSRSCKTRENLHHHTPMQETMELKRVNKKGSCSLLTNTRSKVF